MLSSLRSELIAEPTLLADISDSKSVKTLLEMVFSSNRSNYCLLDLDLSAQLDPSPINVSAFVRQQFLAYCLY